MSQPILEGFPFDERVADEGIFNQPAMDEEARRGSAADYEEQEARFLGVTEVVLNSLVDVKQ